MRLANKVALVVGAGGGMGTSVPFLLAREGAKVVLGARRPEPLKELAAQIRRRLPEGAGELAWATGDGMTADGCAALVRQAIERFGKLDVLYSNLGENLFRDRPLEELDDEAWGFLVHANLSSGFILVRAALPELRRTRGCAILVASAPSVRRRSSPAYEVAKVGLIGLTASLARRLQPDGVRVNCICPGSFGRSEGEAAFAEPPAELVRAAHPGDVGYAAVYLASDQAAWVTGQWIEVDGGASL